MMSAPPASASGPGASPSQTQATSMAEAGTR